MVTSPEIWFKQISSVTKQIFAAMKRWVRFSLSLFLGVSKLWFISFTRIHEFVFTLAPGYVEMKSGAEVGWAAFMQNVTRNSFCYSCRFLAGVRVWFWVIGKCATCFVVCWRWLQETDGTSVILVVTTQPESVHRGAALPGQLISNIRFRVSLENRVPHSPTDIKARTLITNPRTSVCNIFNPCLSSPGSKKPKNLSKLPLRLRIILAAKVFLPRSCEIRNLETL